MIPAPRAAEAQALLAPPLVPSLVPWARAVYAIVGNATRQVRRGIPRGPYLVRFITALAGNGTLDSIAGNGPGSRSYALIAGAIALNRFPPPPDGLAHAIRFTIRR